MRVVTLSVLSLSLIFSGCSREAPVSEQPAPTTTVIQQSSAPKPLADVSGAPEPSGEKQVTAQAKEIYQSAKETAAELGGSAVDQSKDFYQAARENASDMAKSLVEKSGEIYEATKQSATETTDKMLDQSATAWEKTKEAASNMADKSKGYGTEAADRSKALYDSAKRKVEELSNSPNGDPSPSPATVENREG